MNERCSGRPAHSDQASFLEDSASVRLDARVEPACRATVPRRIVTARIHGRQCPLPEVPSWSAQSRNPNLPSSAADHSKTIRRERSDPVKFTSGFSAFFRQPSNNFREKAHAHCQALGSGFFSFILSFLLFFCFEQRRPSAQVACCAP